LLTLCAAFWCAILVAGAIVRPLQLDEVLQLIGTRTPHVASVFDWLRGSPGNGPIGYVLQWALVRIAGFSNLVARLPSILAALLALFAIRRIGVRIGIRSVGLLALIAAVIPMLFRYSIEGRPYLPAFCLTAIATLLLLQFLDRPDGRPPLWRLGAYGLVLASAPLLQGTAATVTIAHGLFVLTDRSMRHNRRRQVAILAAIAVSVLIPVAWSLHMREAWAQTIVRDGYTFAFTFHGVAGFLKDITGGGLICTGLLAGAAVYGYFCSGVPKPAKNLLALTIVTAICGAVAADALGGYFTSPRQAIYCLCGLIVLAAAGWEYLQRRYSLPAFVALGLFAAVALARDVSIVRPKEDWKAASLMLKQAVAQGFCLRPDSESTTSLLLYSMFDRSLDMHRCTASDGKVALIHSSYTTREAHDAAAATLEREGFVVSGTRAAGGTTLEMWGGGDVGRSPRTAPDAPVRSSK
jgi:4-amino-4-deoxy-L-arabinose transferase-like glycosyltransferase